jgi:hypothetical protein
LNPTPKPVAARFGSLKRSNARKVTARHLIGPFRRRKQDDAHDTREAPDTLAASADGISEHDVRTKFHNESAR